MAESEARARLAIEEFAGADVEKLKVDMAKDFLRIERFPPPILVEALLGDGVVAKKRGPNPQANRKRDFVIVLCVMALEMYGFKKTRNQDKKMRNLTSDHGSACSLVAEMVPNISEAGVVKIVDRWSRTLDK